NKDELDVFFKNLKYTNWQVPDKVSCHDVTNARKEYLKLSREFSNKLSQNKSISESEMKKINETLFNYLILKSNRNISSYLNHNKAIFAIKVRMFNKRNLKLEKKKGGANA
ncbi:MAG: hypothetical protein MJ208_03160, partial [Bacilli bacterium]|nr:hypothetical protein [Bacilli bacterium]